MIQRLIDVVLKVKDRLINRSKQMPPDMTTVRMFNKNFYRKINRSPCRLVRH